MYLNTVKVKVGTADKAEGVNNDYILDKIFDQNNKDFNTIDPFTTIQTKVEEVVENEEQRTKNRFESFGSTVSEFGWRLISPPPVEILLDNPYAGENVALMYIGDETEEDVLLLAIVKDRARGGRWKRASTDNLSHLLIVSKTKSDSEKMVDFLKREADDIANILSDYVTLEEWKSGSDLVGEFLDSSTDIKAWKSEESDDPFEREVEEVIGERVSAYIGNVGVQFESGNGEYDTIAMPMGQFGEKYAVEVKDFEDVQEKIEEQEEQSELSSTNLKTKLITQPKGEADRIGLNLIMIVNDIPNETYSNLVREASPVGVTLLNDENYEEKLEEIFIQQGWEQLAT